MGEVALTFAPVSLKGATIILSMGDNLWLISAAGRLPFYLIGVLLLGIWTVVGGVLWLLFGIIYMPLHILAGVRHYFGLSRRDGRAELGRRKARDRDEHARYWQEFPATQGYRLAKLKVYLLDGSYKAGQFHEVHYRNRRR